MESSTLLWASWPKALNTTEFAGARLRLNPEARWPRRQKPVDGRGNVSSPSTILKGADRCTCLIPPHVSGEDRARREVTFHLEVPERELPGIHSGHSTFPAENIGWEATGAGRQRADIIGDDTGSSARLPAPTRSRASRSAAAKTSMSA